MCTGAGAMPQFDSPQVEVVGRLDLGADTPAKWARAAAVAGVWAVRVMAAAMIASADSLVLTVIVVS